MELRSTAITAGVRLEELVPSLESTQKGHWYPVLVTGTPQQSRILVKSGHIPLELMEQGSIFTFDDDD